MPPKLLVVDDEPDLELLLRQKFRRKVRKRELELVFAQNGVQALERLEEHPDIDVVLSDINMPEMDGLTLLKQLEDKLNQDLRAVIVTAYGDMKNIRTAMNRGAFDFVTKPIDFDDLDATITKTLEQLWITREALRSRDELVAIRQELNVAAKMQESVLPRTFPSDDRFSIYAWMTPAREVGGDFYDVFQLENGRMGLVVADVSGKGVPAALFMMISRTVLKGTAIGENDVGVALTEANDLLSESNDESMFVTVFHASFDPASGRLWYANAGHNPPVLIRASGEAGFLEVDPGVIMGALPGMKYEPAFVDLEPGDGILMYTDGVSEAMNADNEEFGNDRLLEALRSVAGRPASDIVRVTVEEVEDFVDMAPQHDDITCLAVSYTGNQS